jgi:predicted lipoprotein
MKRFVLSAARLNFGILRQLGLIKQHLALKKNVINYQSLSMVNNINNPKLVAEAVKRSSLVQQAVKEVQQLKIEPSNSLVQHT